MRKFFRVRNLLLASTLALIASFAPAAFEDSKETALMDTSIPKVGDAEASLASLSSKLEARRPSKKTTHSKEEK